MKTAKEILSKKAVEILKKHTTSYYVVGNNTQLPKVLAAMEEYREQPHKCPVCEGKGIVPNGFYLSVSGIGATSSATPEPCKTCNGEGIVWNSQK